MGSSFLTIANEVKVPLLCETIELGVGATENCKQLGDQALDAQLQPEQSWFANNNLHQGANGGGGGVRCIKPDWLMRFTGRNPFRGCMSKEPRGNELVFDQKVIASVMESWWWRR